jgi:hypothetical protein
MIHPFSPKNRYLIFNELQDTSLAGASDGTATLGGNPRDDGFRSQPSQLLGRFRGGRGSFLPFLIGVVVLLAGMLFPDFFLDFPTPLPR